MSEKPLVTAEEAIEAAIATGSDCIPNNPCVFVSELRKLLSRCVKPPHLDAIARDILRAKYDGAREILERMAGMNMSHANVENGLAEYAAHLGIEP